VSEAVTSIDLSGSVYAGTWCCRPSKEQAGGARRRAERVEGFKVSVGASFALIYSRNDVAARIADGAVIEAESLTLLALNDRVTIDDYKPAFDGKDWFTYDDDKNNQTAVDDRGLIYILKDGGERLYAAGQP
jgi:hypothetical protein